MTKETIEESKKQSEKLEYDTTLDLLQGSSIATPPFVLDPNRLRDYLGKVSKTIIVRGEFESGYLYISSGDIDIQNESIYFYIVDGKIAEGHLYPKEALLPITDNNFIYNLKSLPLTSLPYSLDNPEEIRHSNVIDDLFNRKDVKEKKYYIGAFVSTTRLPNQIKSIQLRYKCKTTSACSIISI